MMMRSLLRSGGLVLCLGGAVYAQTPSPTELASVPNLTTLVGRPGSELAGVVEEFTADQTSLSRRYDATQSPDQRHRMRAFYDAWRMRLREIDFEIRCSAIMTP